LTRAIDRAIDPRTEHRHDSIDALGADLRSATAPPTRRWLLPAATIVLLVIAGLWGGIGRHNSAPRGLASNERPVIAVLPFRNDGAPDTDLFVEGLTYEIMSGLSAIEGIDVTSATSSFAVKDQPRQATSLGRQLGANLLLDGSVLRSGGALRVQAQLVLAADDVVLWSNTFDRRFEDVFAIQDEISLAIVNALRVKLGRGRRYDTNPQIYERYLRARALLRRTGPGTPEVIRILNEVVTADPGFAPAYAAIASAMAKKSYAFPNPDPTNVSPDVANATIRPAAMRAIELDPFLAEAHAAMGIVHSSELDWAGAERAFRQALSLDASQTQIHADFVLSTLWPLGRVEQSRDLLAHAVELDPLSPFLRRLYARMQVSTGAVGEALESLALVRELDPAFALGFLWEEALVFDGRVEEAIALMESRGEGSHGVLGYAYAIAGRRAEAEALAARSAVFPQRQVMIFAGLGDADRAFDALDRLAAINVRRALCYTTYPELHTLRDHPRMAAFRGRYGVR
jgi:TolB-like protein